LTRVPEADIRIKMSNCSYEPEADHLRFQNEAWLAC
jgi:hypothetical protein